MLLWLEEAAIVVVMILAVGVGTFMLVGATWSHVHDWSQRRARRDERPADNRSDRSPVQRRPHSHSV